MTDRYYELARLVRGHSILVEEGKLSVDLDKVGAADLIYNDVQLQAARGPETYFWLSGGGTLLINDRYLAIVQRSHNAQVNPGQFSLFTGRSDNAIERGDPRLVIRELFEELLLFEGDTLLMPRSPEHRPVIDAAYTELRRVGILSANQPTRDLPLQPVGLRSRALQIRASGQERQLAACWTAGSRNDVNILSLFGVFCDLATLRAEDGEFHTQGGTVTRARRAISLYDTASGQVMSLPGHASRNLADEEMSENLRFFLQSFEAQI